MGPGGGSVCGRARRGGRRPRVWLEHAGLQKAIFKAIFAFLFRVLAPVSLGFPAFFAFLSDLGGMWPGPGVDVERRGGRQRSLWMLVRRAAGVPQNKQSTQNNPRRTSESWPKALDSAQNQGLRSPVPRISSVKSEDPGVT